MTGRRIPIDLGGVEETLLLPLWARAVEAEKEDPIVCDAYARDILARIDYDFSRIEAGQSDDHQMVWAIRAYHFDNIVKSFLEHHRDALVVNIGAGLDTTFQRVDNGSVRWVNMDVPDVAALRQELIPDSDREMTLAKSVFDFTWIADIAAQKAGRSVLFMAAGVLCYFAAADVARLLRKLADTYPSAHVVFDSMSWFTLWGANRAIIKKSGMDSSALMRWHLKRASRLREWVSTIRVVEEFPVLSRVPMRKDWSRRVVWGFRIAGLFRMYNMVHVQL
jgi:O-methyltransferase involved in polyketide biosynthesis